MKRRSIFYILLSLIATLMLAFLCACDASKQLSAPSDIAYDGKLISWSAVDHAENYTVQIDGRDAFSVSGTTYPYVHTTDQPFIVQVTAESSKKESSEVTSHTFVPLAPIQTVTVAENGSFSWEPVLGASGYSVSVDGVETTVYNYYYDGLTEGRHSVTVKPIAEGVAKGTTYYSSWSPVKTITICGEVDANSIEYSLVDRSLSWKGVTNAVAYELTISGTGVAPIVETVNTTSYTYNAGLEDFDVSIRALGNHSTSYDSGTTTEKAFVYLEAAQNLRVLDGTLYWDEVSGASGYAVQINGKPYNKTLTECRLSGFEPEKSITVTVMPLSDDTVYFSSWSTEFSFTILGAPVLQWNNLALDGAKANNTYWNINSKASGYEVNILFKGEPVETATLPADSDTHAYDFLEAGEYEVRVKALAPNNSSNLCDSAYSAPIYVTRLAAPAFASNDYLTSDPNNVQNGFTVSFKPVAGATGYQIWKDNEAKERLLETATQYHDGNVVGASVIDAQQYNYAIQSIGRAVRAEMGGAQSVVLDSLTAESLQFMIDVLPVPTNTNISGYEYTYNGVNDSFGYTVDISGQPYVNEDLSFDLGVPLESGRSYQVSVCARGNGTNVLSSNYTPAIAVDRLSAPVDIAISTQDASDGALEFTPVANANGYQLYILGREQPVEVAQLTNVKEYVTTSGTSVHMVTVGNYFNEAKTQYYMTSQASQTKVFTKLMAPTFGEKAFGNAQFSWNAPANVTTSTYTPTYLVYNAQEVIQSAQLNGTSMSTANLDAGTYELKVKAIGDEARGYVNSDFSVSQTMTKLKTPVVTVENDRYTWKAVPEATSYALYVDGVLSSTEYHQSGETFTYTPHFTQAKTYKVEVYAVGNGGITAGSTGAIVDSSACLIEQQTAQLTTPEFAWSYSAAKYTPDGAITLSVTLESRYATGYFFAFDGNTFEKAETSCSFTPNSAGDVRLTVYARGGGFDENGIYYLDSQSTSKVIHLLYTPGNIEVTGDGVLSWGTVPSASSYEADITINGTEYKVTGLTVAKYYLTDLVTLYPELDGVTVGSLSVVVRATGTSNTCITSADSAAKEWTNVGITL